MKKDPRNKVGTTVHAIADRVLGNYAARNIFGNINHAKYFVQGTVVKVFDVHAGGKECLLEADGQLSEALQQSRRQGQSD